MSSRSHTTETATITRVILDALFLNAAMASAYWLRFHSPFTALIPISKGVPPFVFYCKAFPAVTLVFILVFKTTGSYARRWRYDALSEFFLLTRGVIAAMIVLMAITFLLPSTHSPTGVKYSRMTFILTFPLIELFLSMGRIISNAVEKHLYRKSRGKRRLLLIGTGETAARLARHVRRMPSMEREIVGFLRVENERSSTSRVVTPVMGGLERLPELISVHTIDEVILTAPGLPHRRIMEIIETCERNLVDFSHVPDMFEIMTRNVDVVNFDGVPLLGIHRTPLHSPWNRFIKRCFDIAAASVGLIISSPAIALAALAIKLDSKGPVFYAQERLGEDGKRFLLCKLRTMVPDAERETGPVWAKEDDPRRTRVGGFLRKFNLDELPQLYNVLKGDMSLVGPRPERPHFVERFTAHMPHYMTRHRVKSGLTGWAQVNGLRGDTSVRARLRYDMYYLENWSLLFDLKILFMTLFARKNAY